MREPYDTDRPLARLGVRFVRQIPVFNTSRPLRQRPPERAYVARAIAEGTVISRQIVVLD